MVSVTVDAPDLVAVGSAGSAAISMRRKTDTCRHRQAEEIYRAGQKRLQRDLPNPVNPSSLAAQIT